MRVLRSEEAWLLGSETQRKVYFARMQTRNDTQPSSLGNSPLACEDRTKGAESATCGPQRGQGLSNTIHAIPGFAAQSWDQRFAQENPRMVRICTLRITINVW